MIYLIVCPLVFLAGLIDAIGGGGGLISLPAYLLAGIPPHMAIATNKLSSTCGTTVACIKFIKAKLVYVKLAIPTIILALIGSSLGAKISLLVNESIMKYLLFIILPIVAFIVFQKKLFISEEEDKDYVISKNQFIIGGISALIIGCYDGFYGPGTGTFLIICLSTFGKLPIKRANAHAKLINWASNISSLTVYLLSGEVYISLGLAAAICNMLGAWIGASLVMFKGTKIVRPSIILVLFLLGLKILGVY